MTYRNDNESKKGIRFSGSACIVCGWNRKDACGNLLVEGAHIRPYNDSPEFDKADNIVGLCPNHHTEFDAYNFYIDSKTLTLRFYDVNSCFNGLDVSENVKHVKKEHLAYNEYLYMRFHGLL